MLGRPSLFTNRLWQQFLIDAALQYILRHRAVGCPFSTCDGHQTTFAHQDGVLTAQSLSIATRTRIVITLRFYERTKPHPNTFNITTLPQGAYLLQLLDKNNNQVGAKRFVKE